jgi:anthranilate synthase component 2
MLLLIDNYDSFTFNLVQAFQQLGVFPLVLRNDRPEILHLAGSADLAGVVISPGPGGPEGSGLCLDFLHAVPPSVPVLGVCLGHQILGRFAGYAVKRAERVMHGKTSMIHHGGLGLFRNLPNPFSATRYHSLLVDLRDPGSRSGVRGVGATAESSRGELMGLAFADRPWAGVQFHPESILTEHGPCLLGNFARLCHLGQPDLTGEPDHAPRTAANRIKQGGEP